MKYAVVSMEKKLWEVANNLRSNSELELQDFEEPVLGLIFLKFADVRFSQAEEKLKQKRLEKKGATGRERPLTADDFLAEGVVFLSEKARYEYLLSLPENENAGQKINEAMKEIEKHNTDLKGVLPKSYQRLSNRTIFDLLKSFNNIPNDIEGDAFGKIYEYFLGKFALESGKHGGQFFTPTSIVKLIVEIIEPYHGRIYDPACGSGGMFVQSHEFVKRHLENGKKSQASKEIAIYGQEKVERTIRLAKMNLAIHGLGGEIRQGVFKIIFPSSNTGKSSVKRTAAIYSNGFSFSKIDSLSTISRKTSFVSDSSTQEEVGSIP